VEGQDSRTNGRPTATTRQRHFRHFEDLSHENPNSSPKQLSSKSFAIEGIATSLWHRPCLSVEKKYCAGNGDMLGITRSKETVMKMKFMMLALVPLFSLLTLSASAQDIEPVAIANIPFAFYAGHQRMPAGTYTVGLNLENELTSLTDASGHQEIFLPGIPADDGGDETALVFEHTGNIYVLKELKSESLNVTFNTKKPAEAVATSGASSQVEVALNR
jgi:hypothetical protein